ncbi:MAG TPA: Mpo1-like protein [Flavobacteriales bacterium]
MKSIHTWLSEYGESHQHATNKTIHWICVPTIFFSIVGFLYQIKTGWQFGDAPITVAHLVTILIIIYYVILSPAISIGVAMFILLCLTLCGWIEVVCSNPWMVYLILFVVAWIGQFIGHNIEGKKPSFFKDIQYLLIGPAWLLSAIYKKLGIKI